MATPPKVGDKVECRLTKRTGVITLAVPAPFNYHWCRPRWEGSLLTELAYPLQNIQPISS